MKRSIGLVTVWLLFATAAVGVGFAAAGVIEQPLGADAAAGASVSLLETSPGGDDAGQTSLPSATRSPVTVATPAPKGTATSRPSSARPRASTSARPAQPLPTTTPRHTPATQPPRTTPAASTSITRGISTAGGYVSGTCADGLVRVSASPNPGWELKDISPPGRVEGEAEFEETGEGEGKVEVDVRCSGGKPTFLVQAETDDSDSSGSSGSSDD